MKNSNTMVSDTKDLTLLGKASLPSCEEPSFSLFETFLNPSPSRPFEICFSTDEFTSLCPVTGQPDFASLSIQYIPGERCIESKSLKLYIRSFRNQAGFAEVIVNRILDDIIAAIAPQSATVMADFTPRGGIGIYVEACYPQEHA